MVTAHRIDINPHIMPGKPVIKGTRFTVEPIQTGRGSDLLEAYPQITAVSLKGGY